MHDILSHPSATLAKAQTWRVKFHQSDDTCPPKEDSEDRFTFQEPELITANLETASWNEIINASQTEGGFQLTWVPFEIGTNPDFEREIDNYLGFNSSDRTPRLLRVSIRNARIYWTTTRAVLVCDREHLKSNTHALLRFTLIQTHVSHLEKKVKSYWQKIQTDSALAPSQNNGPLCQAAFLSNQRVAETTQMRMNYLRLMIALEQFEPSLNHTAKRLFEEMALAAKLHDRLEILDEPLQFMSDFCLEVRQRVFEQKNTITERRYYSVGLILELIIILLLIVGMWKY